MSAQQIQRAHEKAVQSRLPCTLIGHALGPQFHFTGPLRGFSDVIDRCRVERPELVDSLKETQETFLKSIAGLQQMAEDRSPSTQALLLAFLGADLPGLVFRLRRLADLSAAAKRLPDETLQTPPEGDWSVPTSLADLANRLDNVSLKKAKSILRPYGLKQSGNRQLWTVRLDGMPPNIRQKIERKKQ